MPHQATRTQRWTLEVGEANPSYLEHAIFNTVRYFDLSDIPVTATTIWRTLIIPSPTTHLRWDGLPVFSLAAVTEALHTSPWLQKMLATHWGYYFLAERKDDDIVGRYLAHYTQAQHKWALMERVARVLQYIPYVRSLAVAGSLALYSTKPSSDLDVLIVTHTGRVWTTRLLLLVATQLLGRRRKHWHELAPDKVCLNHYVTDDALAIDPSIRNLFTAIEYTHQIPVVGEAVYSEFTSTNATWYKRFLMYPEAPALPSIHAVAARPGIKKIQMFIEAWLQEPIGDWLEQWAERIQRRIIWRHTVPGRGGRVVLSATELAFHPDSRVDGLLHQFAQDAQQQVLL